MNHLILLTLFHTAVAALTNQGSCPEVAGADALLGPGKRLIVGEMHGNDATPKAIEALACLAARRGQVKVALEIPVEEQSRLNVFLSSPGLKADRNRLLAGPFWHRSLQDGRSSVAMLELLERLRLLRRQRAELEIVAYDATDQGDRDLSMGAFLARQFTADAQASFIVLTGNFHARKTPGSFGRTFMVQSLVAQGVSLTAVLASSGSGGATWVCHTDAPASCGPAPFGKGTGRPLGIRLEPSGDGAFDGILDVGVATWSPPAAVPVLAVQRKNIELFPQRQVTQGLQFKRLCGLWHRVCGHQGDGRPLQRSVLLRPRRAS